ncbi:hypothetical protein NC652_016240 [Populus alba x Populus x berolinensis]|uniref:Uncharacterized protein n=1 Tax=Populus alba x Populus x berolinensis TaxID=444605 RepID=A0AAD6MIY5_9ROSI|nr:hypothetical protein NC652_041409 [Populus alba x Populus x berolinensis]KAJ6893434.1 hypothetical protein NC652_027464 [Populus alba x Populus x berolinensis]KAJ6922532.1 hypothetical protein NC652_016240 [Populus alba x Populus x berolinensis]KAJ6986202.1 hypothetical protein NC653_023943 [Populus alba x Populus x berolinensis]
MHNISFLALLLPSRNCCLNWDGPLSRRGCKEVIF